MTVAGQRADSLLTHRIAGHSSPEGRVAALAYDNPSMVPLRYATSLSRLSPGYDRSSSDAAVRAQQGRGNSTGRFGADTYIHAGDATVWGGAAYENGRIYDVRWCEASDFDIVYPYVTADAVGGDMKAERYSFAGGYAAPVSGFTLGCRLSYAAGHYYRDVDPRPRNITGRLDAAIGVARVIGPYRVGLAVDFMKYRQSNNLLFMSELGEARIYHLTGLGGHYVRFDGLGKDCSYSGERYGVQLDLLPEHGCGFFGAVALHRFSFDYVIRDLNHLPMSSVSDNSLAFECGYRYDRGADFAAVTVAGDYSRRIGRENIFGDPVSGQYPEIGSMKMYGADSCATSLEALYMRRAGVFTFGATARGAISHDEKACLSPRRQWLVDAVMMGVGVDASYTGSCFHSRLRLGYDRRFVTDSSLGGVDGDDGIGLGDVVLSDFGFASADTDRFSASLAGAMAIGRRLALGASVEWSHTSYGRRVSSDGLRAAVSLYF